MTRPQTNTPQGYPSVTMVSVARGVESSGKERYGPVMPSSTGRRSGRQMQPTLIRFEPELLDELRLEAERCGVSVAQYVREAVVAHMAYAAGERDASASLGANAQLRERARRAREDGQQMRSEKRAVVAESEQAMMQARRRRAAAGETFGKSKRDKS